MRALFTVVIYFGTFLLIGFAAKWWPGRRSVDLSDVQDQAGADRKPRKAFLLGAWRTED
jgi:hypothetical protein